MIPAPDRVIKPKAKPVTGFRDLITLAILAFRLEFNLTPRRKDFERSRR